jgi:hypothetical protein
MILLSKEKFLCEVLKKAAEDQGVSCYTQMDLEGMDYLVDDLSAQLVLVDENIWDDSLWGLVDQQKLVYFGEKLPKICDSSCKQLSKPLDPLQMVDRLNEVFAAN